MGSDPFTDARTIQWGFSPVQFFFQFHAVFMGKINQHNRRACPSLGLAPPTLVLEILDLPLQYSVEHQFVVADFGGSKFYTRITSVHLSTTDGWCFWEWERRISPLENSGTATKDYLSNT